MHEETEKILAAAPAGDADGELVGTSRQGRTIRGFRFGSGPVRISLIGGCHADEPVGPLLLRKLSSHLRSLSANHPLRSRHSWWIVPHANPDGEEANRGWWESGDRTDLESGVDLAAYLGGAVRELPGDDVEFGFPRSSSDREARPENRAVRSFLAGAGSLHLHASLHGMAIGAGPWFLVEPRWVDRLGEFLRRCEDRVRELGYRLHDVERNGDKGFRRLRRGFCTRPDSGAMRRFFLERSDPVTAERFRPSSMEAARSFGGDPLTLVSEMPLFITPGVGEELGPPDPALEAWRERIEGWKLRLATGKDSADRVNEEARELGLRAMPLGDQMRLQWAMIAAGVEAVLLGEEEGEQEEEQEEEEE